MSEPLRPFLIAGEASAAAAAEQLAAEPGVAEVVAAAVADVPVQDDLAVPTDPHAAAFFDIDNTIMRGASIFHLARAAYARDMLSRGDVIGFAMDQLRFLRGGEDLDAMAEATAAALAFVKGRTVAEIEQLGEEIYDHGIAGKIWPGTIALAQRHLDAGERVWLVSATPVELARVIAQRLGFTGALGTVSESQDGVYTGNLVGRPLHGVAKAAALRALAAKVGLDLARCSAYSDSYNDLPMLTEVGYPIAVNPDDDLRRAAYENRWPIYDFRRRRHWLRYKLPGLVAGTAAAAAAAGSAATVLVMRRRR